MFAVLNSGTIVFESARPDRVVRFLEKTSSPAGSLIVEIFTPEEFRRKHVFARKHTHRNKRKPPSSRRM